MSSFVETFPGPGYDLSWTQEAGAWTVASGLVRPTNVADYSYARCNSNLTTDNGRIIANVATFTPGSAEMNLFLRCNTSPMLDHSYAMYISSAGDWNISKWVSGVATRLDSGTNNPGALGTNALVSLEIEPVAQTLLAKLNGTLITSAAAADAALTTGTRGGLLLFAGTVTGDAVVETVGIEDVVVAGVSASTLAPLTMVAAGVGPGVTASRRLVNSAPLMSLVNGGFAA